MNSYLTTSSCTKKLTRLGDFLKDESIHKVISIADVIFVNNYAFDSALNQALVIKFLGNFALTIRYNS